MSHFFSEFVNNNMKPSEDLRSAIVPLLKLLCLTLIGLVLSRPKTQFIPKDTFKLLSKLVFAIFLPCLIFVHLGGSITVQNVKLWWFLPVNVLISTIIGCILGYCVVIICRPPPQYVRFTVIMTAFGNTGNLPLAIISSVCHSDHHPFGPNCRRTGVAYVSFTQWVAVILVYTFVFHMMEPPLQYYEIVNEEEPQEDDVSNPLLVEAEWPGLEETKFQNSKKPFVARIFNSITSASHTILPEFNPPRINAEGAESSPRFAINCLPEPRVVRKIRIVAEQTPYQQILQPPTIASLLAFVIGMIPQLKAFFFAENAPLSVITDSLEILAGAMVPSVMLILGGMLAEGPNESKLGLRTTIGIIFTRLLVLPLLGIGVLATANKLNILVHGDQMYRFVVLLQYTTPSAILLGAIANLRGYAVSEASAILFWQHLCALFSLSFYIFIYFKWLL